MAAEEAACGGGVEVREAELPVEEAPAASEESKETVEGVGEEVSGPVVAANGDSGDLSGKVSNLVARPDPAVIGEEVVESNAALGCAGTVHEGGVDGGLDAGAVDDAPIANGHVQHEAPACVVEEVNGDQAGLEIAELVEQEEQEVNGQELEGMIVSTADEHDDHTKRSTAAESKVHVEDGLTKAVAADATDLIKHEAINGEQDNGHMTNGHGQIEAEVNSVKPVDQEVTGIIRYGLNGSVINVHGHTDASADVHVADAVFEVKGNKSKGKDISVIEELVTATVDHDQADIPMTNGHDQVERGSDSGEVDTKSEVCGEKNGECATDATELVRQDAATGEQGTENAYVVSACDHSNTNANSDETPTHILFSSNESCMVQSVVESMEVHHEETLKVVDQCTEGIAKLAKVAGEDILTNGCENVHNKQDTLQGTITSGVDKAANAYVVEENEDTFTDSTEKKEKHEKTNDTLEGHDNFEVAEVEKVEFTAEVEAHDNFTEKVETRDLENFSGEEKEETREHASLREASLVSDQQQDTKGELSAIIVNHVADNTELKQESDSDMEIFDGAKLYSATAPAVISALHGETRSQDLSEVHNSIRACDRGTSSDALTGHNDSKENYTASVVQVEQAGPSPDDVNCPANAFTASSCMAKTEYVQDIADTDITGNGCELQLEINMDNEDRRDLHVIKPHSLYLMQVPRFMKESHWAKIQDAQIHLDELTQKRDAINLLRQKKKALCDEYREQLEAARQEERGARTAHGDKKNDLNSVQSMIGRMNRANSIQEIDDMIAMKEKIIAHESISLKEEKRLLQDIKELKAQKKQLYSNMGSKAEMGEVFQQKEHIHEQHKILKKDSDVLLTNLKSLEDKTRVIKKAFDDERDALRKLTQEHQAAHEVRQKAYDEWVELKKEPAKKNRFFFMYRKDSADAQKYRANKDLTGLLSFCNNQVESFMELWNKDDDFRRQYVESNKISTLRRLGTSDGRKLGPDEVPPEIPRYSNRMQSNPSLLPVPSTHVSTSASEAMPAKPASAITSVEEKTFPVLQGSKNSKPSKPKVAGNSSSKGTPGGPMPEREDLEKSENEKMHKMEESEVEKIHRMEKELELSRKAAELAIKEEEFRQEKAAAEKERLRLEQKAKAKEAEERKRRKAEKALERAEFRARKEAELMEKKKAKKDKTRGSTSVASVNGSGEGTAEAIVPNDPDSSTTENSRGGDFSQHKAMKKKTSRPSVVLKQLNKMDPMPLPLRNKGRRKMRQYIMVAVAAVVSVLALVVANKYVPSNFRASSS
ncbi:uncharacterized protein LOC102718863 isoform X2 [Oryza brachyantha]|uniref:uncharacterized protein LOC102718863 isoform X2 n=1 Tax=Oryza brachyantha TaxID=4533 RepID=UPI00077665C3|nr:uncharacterized protein LOC102718863 isoform X2 [Oryza brachyantha]